MPAQDHTLLHRIDIPQTNGMVGAPRGQRMTYGRKSGGEYFVGMTFERAALRTSRPVPDFDFRTGLAAVALRSELATPGGCEIFAIRRIGHGTNPVVMPFDAGQQRTGCQFDLSHLPPAGSAGDRLTVRRYGYRERLIHFGAGRFRQDFGLHARKTRVRSGLG